MINWSYFPWDATVQHCNWLKNISWRASFFIIFMFIKLFLKVPILKYKFLDWKSPSLPWNFFWNFIRFGMRIRPLAAIHEQNVSHTNFNKTLIYPTDCECLPWWWWPCKCRHRLKIAPGLNLHWQLFAKRSCQTLSHLIIFPSLSWWMCTALQNKAISNHPWGHGMPISIHPPAGQTGKGAGILELMKFNPMWMEPLAWTFYPPLCRWKWRIVSTPVWMKVEGIAFIAN